MCIRRTVLETVGGFADDLGRIGKRPLGCEETELCIRARQRFPGRRFEYEPAAVVQHKVPAARARYRYFVSRCLSEGLSKAVVTDRVGSRDGLSAELPYTGRVLTTGVLRNVGDFLSGRGPAALARAATICLGLVATGTGYVAGLVQRRLGSGAA